MPAPRDSGQATEAARQASRVLEPAPARDEQIWTALVLGLFGVLAFVSRIPWVFAGGLALVFLGALARSRLGYYLTPEGMFIRTLAGSRTVPWDDLQRVEYVELGGGLRLLAAYFPGYAVGLFYLAGLGRQHLLASSDRGQGIRVHPRRGGPFIITPRDPIDALAAFEQRGVPVEAPKWILREVRRRARSGAHPRKAGPTSE
ncbi:MAG TPA: PH domain-containing protein [Thermaerobacter sp.]